MNTTIDVAGNLGRADNAFEPYTDIIHKVISVLDGQLDNIHIETCKE